MLPYGRQSISEEDVEAVAEVLRGDWLTTGPAVDRFEAEVSRLAGGHPAVSCTSGTTALHMAYAAAGIGPGDEVITVPMTFVATVAAIVYTGAKPVLVDVDPLTWTMDPARVEEKITSRTRAVVPVHLHGRLADMAAIGEVARRHGLTVIEDACQAHGAERDGVRAGAFGDIGCFSFYPGKNLGACGEGGALTTNRADFARTARQLRDWGQEGRYNHVRHAFNYRMDAVQGAALGVKLAHLDDWNSARRRVANAYNAGLIGNVTCPAGPFGADHACHVYAVRVQGRADIRTALNDAGVATNIHYPVPVHLQPAYAELGYRRGDFPVSEALADEMLSLPLYPELSNPDVRRVIAAINMATAGTLARSA